MHNWKASMLWKRFVCLIYSSELFRVIEILNTFALLKSINTQR
jgi:hypothetical protein